jgi:SOS-response transcriptional repressor LexA
MRPPTNRQLQVLGLIAVAIKCDGYPPTLRSLCDTLGIGSENSLVGHIRALIDRGLLTKQPLISRGLQITTQGYAWLAGAWTASAGAERKPLPRIVDVVVGSRCAGCNAMMFDMSKPCPMCALAKRKVA